MFCRKKADEQKTREAFREIKSDMDALKLKIATLGSEKKTLTTRVERLEKKVEKLGGK